MCSSDLLFLEQEADDHGWQGAERDSPRGAARLVRSGAKRSHILKQSAGQPQDVRAEVNEHGDQRAELDHDGEGVFGVVVAEKRADGEEVGGAADREEFREPLDETEQGRFPNRHAFFATGAIAEYDSCVERNTNSVRLRVRLLDRKSTRLNSSH